MLQKLIYSIFNFLSSKFSNFYVFLFLELFLDEPAMVLRYWQGYAMLCLKLKDQKNNNGWRTLWTRQSAFSKIMVFLLFAQFGTKDAQIHKICHQLLSDQLTHQGHRYIRTNSFISWFDHLCEQVESREKWSKENYHKTQNQGKCEQWQFWG
jgi:hypothetical protein